MSSAKSLLRSVYVCPSCHITSYNGVNLSGLWNRKNYAKGYSDIQIKVRAATSNDAVRYWEMIGTLRANWTRFVNSGDLQAL